MGKPHHCGRIYEKNMQILEEINVINMEDSHSAKRIYGNNTKSRNESRIAMHIFDFHVSSRIF